MTESKSSIGRRLGILLILTMVIATALIGPHETSASASCVPAAIARYYSDATHTTQVGICTHACCQLWTCTGQLTQYEVDKFFDCSGE